MNEFARFVKKYLWEHPVRDSVYPGKIDICKFFESPLDVSHCPPDTVRICSKALEFLEEESELYKLIKAYKIYSRPRIQHILRHYGGPENLAREIIICGEMLMFLTLKRINISDGRDIYPIRDTLQLRFSLFGIEKSLTDSDVSIKHYISNFCNK